MKKSILAIVLAAASFAISNVYADDCAISGYVMKDDATKDCMVSLEAEACAKAQANPAESADVTSVCEAKQQ